MGGIEGTTDWILILFFFRSVYYKCAVCHTEPRGSAFEISPPKAAFLNRLLYIK